MRRASIIYAPRDSAIAALAAELERAFDSRHYIIRIKDASKVAVPDLAAADIILIGSMPEGRSVVHPSFAEILRALKGVNLAGRVAGIFAVGSRKTSEALRRALEDSDVILADEELILEMDTENRHVERARSWVQMLIEHFDRHLKQVEKIGEG